MIEIEDLYKLYGDRRAVGPVSATIQKGEIVGLLGLNGAGKTTTLRILACDLLPSSGRVRVDGFDVVDDPDAVRARIGYLPDVPPLYPEMTVREYLTFAARLRKVPAAEVAARVADAARLTEIAARLDDLVGSLSHGFRQRVGIAQAIVHRPSLLILDEPISGLDPVQIVEMRALVRSLAGERTVIVSSHILSEISETCDRIFMIRDGEIVAQGTEAELSAQFLSGMTLELTVQGAGAAEPALAAVEGVTSVEAIEPAEPGTSAFRVVTRGDQRAAILAALVGAGVPVLGLARAERELEDVFLRLAASEEGGERVRKARRRRRNAPAEVAS